MLNLPKTITTSHSKPSTLRFSVWAIGSHVSAKDVTELSMHWLPVKGHWSLASMRRLSFNLAIPLVLECPLVRISMHQAVIGPRSSNPGPIYLYCFWLFRRMTQNVWFFYPVNFKMYYFVLGKASLGVKRSPNFCGEHFFLQSTTIFFNKGHNLSHFEEQQQIHPPWSKNSTTPPSATLLKLGNLSRDQRTTR